MAARGRGFDDNDCRYACACASWYVAAAGVVGVRFLLLFMVLVLLLVLLCSGCSCSTIRWRVHNTCV